MGASMTDTAADAPADATQEALADATPAADATDWKAEARKWEQRAKENHTKATTLERAQRAAMTDAERAVAEAEARGRTAARSEYGSRLARERFDALAGRRNPDYDTTSALEYVDLSKFLTEEGEPDAKAIESAVKRLVPEAAGATPSFDGGARRSPAKASDMNTIIRRAAGHTG